MTSSNLVGCLTGSGADFIGDSKAGYTRQAHSLTAFAVSSEPPNVTNALQWRVGMKRSILFKPDARNPHYAASNYPLERLLMFKRYLIAFA